MTHVILDRFRLDDQVAVVTGAGRGLGAAMAVAFAEAGADVVIAARTQSQLEEVAGQIEAVASELEHRQIQVARDAGRWVKTALGDLEESLDSMAVRAVSTAEATRTPVRSASSTESGRAL